MKKPILSTKNRNPPIRPAYEEMLDLIKVQQEEFRHMEKEIYGNIGQVLCLIRIHLANTDPGDKEKITEMLEQSKMLIGKAIRDLRNLAKQANKQ